MPDVKLLNFGSSSKTKSLILWSLTRKLITVVGHSSFCLQGGGGWPLLWRQPPPPTTLLKEHGTRQEVTSYTPTPWYWHLVVTTEVVGMHPTGMLSCYSKCSSMFLPCRFNSIFFIFMLYWRRIVQKSSVPHMTQCQIWYWKAVITYKDDSMKQEIYGWAPLNLVCNDWKRASFFSLLEG